jgi:hypothetical protein
MRSSLRWLADRLRGHLYLYLCARSIGYTMSERAAALPPPEELDDTYFMPYLL